MSDRIRRLLIDLEISHNRFLRREAIAFLVLSYAEGEVDEFGVDAIVGTYGPFATPEEALVQAGKHDNASLEGFRNVIVPLYPPVQWKDGS